MIKINFTVDADGSVHEFDMGDMDIHINDEIITSRNKVPSQSMMIFIAVSELLEAIYNVTSMGKKQVEFIGTDSSFRLCFSRSKNGNISLSYADRVFNGIDELELKNAVLSSATDLMEKYENKIQGNGAAIGDLSYTIAKLKQ